MVNGRRRVDVIIPNAWFVFWDDVALGSRGRDDDIWVRGLEAASG